MKTLRGVLLTLLLFVAPLLSFAAGNKKSITLAEPVKVGSTVLQPGDYTVEWNGTGSNVQVQFKQNSKTVATAPASIKNQNSAYDKAVDVRSVNGSDTKALRAIDFKSTELVFDEGSTSATQ